MKFWINILQNNTHQSTFVSPAGCPDESVLFRCSVRNSQRTAAVSLSYGVFHKMMQFYFHLEYVAFPISRAIGLYNSNLPAIIWFRYFDFERRYWAAKIVRIKTYLLGTPFISFCWACFSGTPCILPICSIVHSQTKKMK